MHPAVRQALYERQRAFATQPGGAVLDGRDIGTVIAPDADVKLYVIAGLAERAARRHAELVAGGRNVTLEAITADLAARDERDSGRSDAPLRAAGDAIVLDTSRLGRDAAVARAIAIVEGRMNRPA